MEVTCDSGGVKFVVENRLGADSRSNRHRFRKIVMLSLFNFNKHSVSVTVEFNLIHPITYIVILVLTG